jgi:3-oxoacyl-[acyl-carrier protein] reductase
MLEMTNEDWDKSIELNMRSVFLCCREFGRPMMAQKYGRMITLSSRSGFGGTANQAHYSAAKSAVVAMSKALARELGGYGITCNVVAPGRIETPMTRIGLERNWWGDYPMSMFPMGRWGKAEDVAAAIAYFASDEAGWVTGQTLHVNGGSFMF